MRLELSPARLPPSLREGHGQLTWRCLGGRERRRRGVLGSPHTGTSPKRPVTLQAVGSGWVFLELE